MALFYCCKIGSCNYPSSYFLSTGYFLFVVKDNVFFGSVARECGSKKNISWFELESLGSCDLH